MAEGSDVSYWNLIFIGAMLLGAIILWLVLRSKPREQEMHDPETEAGTRELYAEEEERRLHERDQDKGL